MNGHGCVLVQQVAKQEGVGYRYGARIVQAMCSAGFLERVDIEIVSLSPLVCTALGCKVSGDILQPLSGVRTGTLRHDLRVVDVERALLREDGGTFEPARRVALRRAELGIDHIPDGIWHRLGHPPTFVELELSLKSPTRLKKIIAGYARNLNIQSVLYLVEDAKIGRVLQAATRDHEHIKIALVTPQNASR